jgi:hypothetical protein
MRRYQALPDRQRGIVVLGLLANSLIGTGSYVALGAALIRSVRRIWRARRLGPARAAGAGVDPILAGALATHVGWRIAAAWVTRAVDDGRGQAWLDRADRWVTERADAAGPAGSPPDSGAEGFAHD